MNKFLVQIFFLNILFISSAFSQPLVQLGDDDWTSTSANGPCNCSNDFNNGSFMNFFDTGGAGMPYSPNEYEVITLCPDSTGSKMVVAFGINAGYTLNIHPSDTLFVYDGPSINDPLLAAINDSTYPNGINIPASWNNISGCLTFKFVSDASFQGLGWDANLSCANLIQPFSNHISAFITGNANGGTDTLNDLNPVDTGYVDICFGDIIEFVAQPYFPYEPNGDSAALSGGGYMQSTNYTVTWELSDGTSFTSNSFLFTPAARNGYFVSLKIEDPMGQFQYSFCKIRVSTQPSFSSCQPAQSPICLGRVTQLFGGVTGADTVGVDPVSTNFPIGGVFGAQTYLPDGSGINYNTNINISGFTPLTTIQNASDIDQMCIKIEHSYLGDLEMKLTCPNGQNINVFNSYSGNGLFPGGFGGGSTFLGGAYDNNTGNIGYCEEYCFSNNANAMPAWVNSYATTTATGPSAGQMIVPGLYQPEQSFIPALQGCPINGTWTLTVRDNLGIDDGYICEWGIYFNSTLHPNSETYAPLITSHNWLPDSTIISNQDTNIIVQPNSLGTSSYTFVVEDEYGCFYDTVITVQTIQGGSIIGDTTTCDDFFDYANNYLTPAGGNWLYFSNDGNLTFDPNNNVANPTITASNPGIYYMGLNDVFCNDTLTHIVEFIDQPEPYPFSLDTFCIGENILAVINNIDTIFSYEWFDYNGDLLSIGDSLILNSNNYTIGSHEINLSVSNECGEEITTSDLIIEKCEIPNVITPNGDGQNDFFYTHFAAIYNDVHLTVVNRWGIVVYESISYQNDWNGVNSKGNPLSEGTYYFFLTFDEGKEKNQGIVQIIINSN